MKTVVLVLSVRTEALNPLNVVLTKRHSDGLRRSGGSSKAKVAGGVLAACGAAMELVPGRDPECLTRLAGVAVLTLGVAAFLEPSVSRTFALSCSLGSLALFDVIYMARLGRRKSLVTRFDVALTTALFCTTAAASLWLISSRSALVWLCWTRLVYGAILLAVPDLYLHLDGILPSPAARSRLRFLGAGLLVLGLIPALALYSDDSLRTRY